MHLCNDSTVSSIHDVGNNKLYLYVDLQGGILSGNFSCGSSSLYKNSWVAMGQMKDQELAQHTELGQGIYEETNRRAHLIIYSYASFHSPL